MPGMESRWIPTPVMLTILILGCRCSLHDPSIVLQTSKVVVNLPYSVSLPYFGKSYNRLYVLREGMVALDVRAQHDTSRRYGERDNWRSSEDFPFVAAGMLKADNKSYVAVKYDVFSGKDNQQLLSLQNVLRDSFIGAEPQNLSFAISVSWENYTVDSKMITSTHLTLATNGGQTFAMFYFLGNDSREGAKEQVQNGFNRGYGRGWIEVLSQNETMLLYQIEKEEVVKGGCDSKRENPVGTLYLSERVVGMFGGNLLEVSGPCFHRDDNISIVYGNSDQRLVFGECYFVSFIKAKCDVPPLTVRGRVQVGVSLDGGRSTFFHTTITVAHPTSMKYEVSLLGSWWGATTPKSLSVKWNSRLLSLYNNAIVDVTLIGFMENKSHTLWNLEIPLGSGVTVGDSNLTFSVANVPCDDTCAEYEAGFVAVRLQNIKQANTFRTLTSGAIPFGWLISGKMTQRYGDYWIHDRCVTWYNEEIRDLEWIQYLANCPCNLQQALLDFGQWQTDLSCNMFSKGPTCAFHKGAVHCVRSAKIPSRSKPAGNQCCYGPDSQLMYSADTFQGSTPDKAHDWGAIPYGAPGSVPSLSHGLSDVLTFLYCCTWADYADCDLYMDVRPTRDCKEYVPPQQAVVYGQSHIKSFDGASFRVCSEGDFILLENTNIIIHGRFQRFSNISVSLTSIGMRIKDEDVFISLKDVDKNPYGDISPDVNYTERVLDVRVNGQYQYYDKEESKWQDFKECSIANNDDITIKQHSNFTIIANNGIGIQITASEGLLNLVVMLPSYLKNQSTGLLRGWNSNTTDDLIGRPHSRAVRRESHAVSQVSRNDTLLNAINTWAVLDRNEKIIPYTIPFDNSSCRDVKGNVTADFCELDRSCLFDLMSTGDKALANATWQFVQRYFSAEQSLHKTRSCGLLNVPRSIKSNHNYSLGSTVHIAGCREGEVHGTSTYSCVEFGDSQVWNPEITAECRIKTNKGRPDDNDLVLILSLTCAGVGVFCIIVTAVVVTVTKKHSRKQEYSIEMT